MRKFTENHLHINWWQFPVLKKTVSAPFPPLTQTERAAHAVDAEWQQSFVHTWACPGYPPTCYKLLATGRTWSSGWSGPGRRAVMPRRAGPCRCHTRSRPWRSSSRAAQRTRCPAGAAMDRNALVGNQLQRKEKGTPSSSLTGHLNIHWILPAIHSAVPTPSKRLWH